MTSLNARQLAFLLDIKKEDARAKMCNAWEATHGISKLSDANGFDKTRGANWNDKGKIESQYPDYMPILILQQGLNIPQLQSMVDDIHLNYLNRPASKKYILVDFPEKFIKKCENDGKKFPVKIDIPPALKSMLPDHSIKSIYDYWRRFLTNDKQPRFIING